MAKLAKSYKTDKKVVFTVFALLVLAGSLLVFSSWASILPSGRAPTGISRIYCKGLPAGTSRQLCYESDRDGGFADLSGNGFYSEFGYIDVEASYWDLRPSIPDKSGSYSAVLMIRPNGRPDRTEYVPAGAVPLNPACYSSNPPPLPRSCVAKFDNISLQTFPAITATLTPPGSGPVYYDMFIRFTGRATAESGQAGNEDDILLDSPGISAQIR